MAKFVNTANYDLLLAGVQSGSNSMRLLSNYTFGDSYATVVANTVAAVAMTSGDFTLGGSAGARTLTTATKSATATANTGASPNLHVAFVNTSTSTVHWVTDELSDQVINSGIVVNFPALVLTIPVAV